MSFLERMVNLPSPQQIPINYSVDSCMCVYVQLPVVLGFMSSHVPSFSVLRSVDLNLIKADGSLGSSVLDPVVSQATCRLRQTDDDR